MIIYVYVQPQLDTRSCRYSPVTKEARLSARRRRNFKAAKVLLMKHAKRRDNGVPADRLEIRNGDCPTRRP